MKPQGKKKGFEPLRNVRRMRFGHWSSDPTTAVEVTRYFRNPFSVGPPQPWPAPVSCNFNEPPPTVARTYYRSGFTPASAFFDDAPAPQPPRQEEQTGSSRAPADRDLTLATATPSSFTTPVAPCPPLLSTAPAWHNRRSPRREECFSPPVSLSPSIFDPAVGRPKTPEFSDYSSSSSIVALGEESLPPPAENNDDDEVVRKKEEEESDDDAQEMSQQSPSRTVEEARERAKDNVARRYDLLSRLNHLAGRFLQKTYYASSAHEVTDTDLLSTISEVVSCLEDVRDYQEENPAMKAPTETLERERRHVRLLLNCVFKREGAAERIDAIVRELNEQHAAEVAGQ